MEVFEPVFAAATIGTLRPSLAGIFVGDAPRRDFFVGIADDPTFLGEGVGGKTLESFARKDLIGVLGLDELI